MSSKMAVEDQSLIDQFTKEFVPSVVIVKRAQRGGSRAKVNVYVDGVLWTVDEDLLQRLLDIGFWIRVK